MLIAFGLGVLGTWLVMRGSSTERPQPAIQNFVPPNAVDASNLGISQRAPVASAEPPDVSQLSPAEAARTLANWNYDRENWQPAIKHYEQAIASGADTPDVRTDLGNCYRFSGQPQKALEQYQIAQKENPQHENSLFNQISLFDEVLHDHNRAVSTAREFLARFPQSSKAAAARKVIQP
jgi:tetratricopeptide (TPR) repeat protein